MFRNRHFHTIYIALAVLSVIIIIGVLGFVFIEGYTLVEAVYMTIITVSTVGFEEVRPLSNFGMLFTTVLILFSFSIFAYAVRIITKMFIDGELKKHYKEYKTGKKIRKMNNHVIICGYGRNGRQAVTELLTHNETVIIIEKDEDVIKEIMQTPNLQHIQGEATHDDVMEKAGIKSAKALITTFPSDADNLFVVITARQINPTIKIISRASDDHSDIKLKRAGATNVIMPDKVGGMRMAKLVAQPDMVEFIEAIMLRSSGDKVNLVEISCKNEINSCFLNKTIGELDIRKLSGANLIGLKNRHNEYIFNPSPEIVLHPDDKLFALGSPSQILKLKASLGSNQDVRNLNPK